MKLVLISICLIAVILAGCADRSGPTRSPIIGTWESETPPKFRMLFESEKVTFLEVTKCCGLDEGQYKVTELEPGHFSIDYRWKDPRLNLEISSFDVVVKGDVLETRCIYETLRKNDTNRYPMMIDQGAPCTYLSFRRIQ